MAYYDALIAKWATLTPGTTAQKLAQLNAMTVTGSIPTTIFITGVQVFNCIDYAEFKLLTDAKKAQMLAALAVPGPLLGGSANTGHLLVGLLLDFFPSSPAGPTITALTALSKGLTQTWASANGYPDAQLGGGGITLVDLANAGGLT